MPEELKQAIKLAPEVIEDAYKRGFNSGTLHATPSPETAQRLLTLENSLTQLTQAFTKHSQIKEEKLDELLKTMEEFKDGMKDVKMIKDLMGNTSFAANLFWKIAISIGAIITFSLGTYLMIKQLK